MVDEEPLGRAEPREADDGVRVGRREAALGAELQAAVEGHRDGRTARDLRLYEWGEYRFWFAYADTPDGLGEPVLAFESTGHAWKRGPDGDSFDFNRTYASVGRNIDVLLSAFDAWRAD